MSAPQFLVLLAVIMLAAFAAAPDKPGASIAGSVMVPLFIAAWWTWLLS